MGQLIHTTVRFYKEEGLYKGKTKDSFSGLYALS